MSKVYKQDLFTDSGMFALWDYDAYKHIDDYDKWEPLFVENEDIEKQIKNNTFVPVYFHQDGCFGFELKMNEELGERERKYIIVQSEEYLFRSSGKAVLSGIDYIYSNIRPEETLIIDMPEGFYSVKIYLIAWDDDPEAYLENGDVSPDALPDCILVVKSDADREKVYRTRVNTFSEDD